LSDERKNDSYFNSQNSIDRDSEIDSEKRMHTVYSLQSNVDLEGDDDLPTAVLSLRVPFGVMMAYRSLDKRRKRLLRRIVSATILSLAQRPVKEPGNANIIVNVNVNENKAVSNVTLDPEVLEKENKVLRVEKKRLKETIEFYEKELERRDQDIRELQQKLREAQEKLRDLQQLESLRTQLEQLRRENESLRRWIQEALLRLEKGNVDSAKALLNSLVKSKPLG